MFPLLGVAGAVSNMIAAFRLAGAGGPDAAVLAGQINHSNALVVIGIVASLPAIFAWAWFKNRLAFLVKDVETLANILLTQVFERDQSAADHNAAHGITRHAVASSIEEI